jgi:D-alanyl-D-alanine carboxypeptidase/D-alanyl-D-alanine-endopeptidase (penicillin-binding protein 4)
MGLARRTRIVGALIEPSGRSVGAGKLSLACAEVRFSVRPQRVLVAVGLMIIVIGVVVGVVTGAFGSISGIGVPSTPSTRSGASTPSSVSTASKTPAATPAATASPARLPAPVLLPANSGRLPDAGKLVARINAVHVKDVKGHYSGAVVDVGSGRLVFAHSASTGLIPASTMKLLTSAAALSVLGPEHTFTTFVVRPKARQIVLVGGGDPYLAKKAAAGEYPRRASIADLAKVTAAQLKAKKVTRVSLGYDSSLFAGPAWNPAWPDGYGDQVSRTSALWVDEGRVYGSPGPRFRDPAKQAASTFAAALRKRGIAVTSVAPARAPRSAARIASVHSMPLERIVERLLLTSDNDAAETLLRQVAIGTRRPGTAADGVQAVKATLSKLGAWDAGTRISDGSGLARQTRVSADEMVKVLRAAAQDGHPGLRAIITGLPVAGVEGSLRTRFFDDASLAGRGVVRAKTGTLRKVHTLAGIVRTADGSVLVFAFLINNPKNDYAATVWLDRVTTAISSCGCR